MFTVEVDDSRIKARLAAMPDGVRKALVKKVTELSFILEGHIKGQKLSGQVLNVVTGALRRSIFSKPVESTATSVTGRVASSGDVKYAAIHEFGGTINIPEIVPTKAQALYFVIDGKDVFAKRVRAHTVNMPERSYMRTSLSELKNQIIEGLTEAVREGLNEK